MEYRRRRKRRRPAQGGSSGAGRVVAVLLVAGVIIYVISASAVGTWLAENVFAPLLSTIETALVGKPVDSGGDSGSNNSPGLDINVGNAGGNTLSEEVTLPGVKCFMLQMGVFSNEANANSLAGELKARGAGGYVIEDGGRYRVMASGYDDEASLLAVREQLKNEGMETAAFVVEASGASFKVTAEETLLAGVKGGFAALKEAQGTLGTLAINFDKDSYTVEQGKNNAASILEKLESARDQLGEKASDSVLSAVQNCYDTCIDALIGLAEYPDSATVDFSSKIKYTHLKVTDEYAKLVNMLSSMT